MSAATDPRQAVWDALRLLDAFTSADLTAAGASRMAVHNYLTAWEAAGHIRRTGLRDRFVVYERRSEAAEAPDVPVRAGDRLPKGRAAQQLWTAARFLDGFDAIDLSSHASTEALAVTPGEAQAFASMLLRAGYLKVVRKARPPQHLARYRLLRNTGPEAPFEKRVRAVYDPNKGEYVHVPEVQR